MHVTPLGTFTLLGKPCQDLWEQGQGVKHNVIRTMFIHLIMLLDYCEFLAW